MGSVFSEAFAFVAALVDADFAVVEAEIAEGLICKGYATANSET